jgi:hypothetical protein
LLFSKLSYIGFYSYKKPHLTNQAGCLINNLSSD